jgi:catechol 2,3-dioxygenase-like lactoylglutathione lyase family enzyme
MSGITHIGTVLIGVGDQDAALAFWHRLGFETRIDGPFGDGGRWIEVAPAGAQTSLALVPRGAGAGPASTEVSLATADAAAAHATLRDSGADADAELIELGGGVPPMFTFRDPDGNPFRVVERR